MFNYIKDKSEEAYKYIKDKVEVGYIYLVDKNARWPLDSSAPFLKGPGLKL